MIGVILVIMVSVMIIIIYTNLNNRIDKLESLIKKQAKNFAESKMSTKNISDFTKPVNIEKGFLSRPISSDGFNEGKDEYHEIQQNLKKSLETENNFVEKKYEEDFITKFFIWLAKDWPMKVGAFLVISAIGWFVSYTFRNDWISPEGRIFLGLLFGIVLLIIGAFRSFKSKVQGNVLMIVGGISVLVANISGVVIYELFPVEAALVVSLLVVTFLAAMSMKQKNLSFGVVTYLLGAIVPVFVLGKIEINTFFLYLFVLTSGTLWTVYKTKWRTLTVISLFVVTIYSLIFYVVKGFDRDTINLVFSFIFTAVFYFANVVALMSSKKITFADLFVSAGTGLLFLMWMGMVAPKDLISMFVLLGAFIFAVGSFVLYKFSASRHPVSMYSVVSLTLLATATAIELEGFALTIALITEFTLVIIFWIALSFSKKLPSINFSSVLIFGIPAVMSLINVAELFEYIAVIKEPTPTVSSHLNNSENLFVVFYICLATFLIGISILYFSARKNKSISIEQRFVLRTFLAIGGMYATVLVWIVAHLICLSFNINTEIAIMISLIIYTLVGIYFYVVGKTGGNMALRIVGDLLFAIVIARVFFVEFWEMDIVQRIITLFIVGGLLISTVFLERKKK
ncbi:MAG: DUF2339 domain-containing protein [Candidatus Moranbacteria bacterium]|nr:DUF2339 domain-containing protein [Candidatus Moranbacteria bacterium]